MEQTATHRFRQGLAYGVTAYGLWGLLPLYLKALGPVDAFELLAHRIVWSLAMLLALTTALRLWGPLREALRRPAVKPILALSTMCIGCNWFCFIYGVATSQMIYTSLGYFITPLVNILFGLVFFRERLSGTRHLAVALAISGVACHTYAAGSLPWLSLALAGSFGLYGLLRKKAPIAALEGNTVEMLGLLPLGLAIYFILNRKGALSWGSATAGYDLLLVFSGPATTLPLLAFAAAARRLPLSVLGMLQYLAPSLQFVQAVFLFGEPFRPFDDANDLWKLAGFLCVWAGLAIFTWDLRRGGGIGVQSQTAPKPTMSAESAT